MPLPRRGSAGSVHEGHEDARQEGVAAGEQDLHPQVRHHPDGVDGTVQVHGPGPVVPDLGLVRLGVVDCHGGRLRQ